MSEGCKLTYVGMLVGMLVILVAVAPAALLMYWLANNVHLAVGLGAAFLLVPAALVFVAVPALNRIFDWLERR